MPFMVREKVLERIRAICLALPEVSERLSHGAPTFFVRGKRAFVMVADEPPRRRALRDLVRGAGRAPGNAGGGRSRTVLRPAVRGASVGWASGSTVPWTGTS